MPLNSPQAIAILMENVAYKVQLENFEGPLDLLLYLVRRDEVDIHDIALDRIATQYLAYIDRYQLLDLDLAAEFLSMAANLIYWKSRTLLPVQARSEGDPEEDENDPRWDLIRQLIEYKKFKEAAAHLASRAAVEECLFARAPGTRAPAHSLEPPPLAPATTHDLTRAFERVLKRFREKDDSGDILNDAYTVRDKIDHLLQSVKAGESLSFQSLFHDAREKAELIVTFLALLELMKMNQFIALQGEILGKIMITRLDGVPEGYQR